VLRPLPMIGIQPHVGRVGEEMARLASPVLAAAG
jgi:hypothetical protein